MDIIKLANKLDSQGQFHLADEIDNYLFSIAKSNDVQKIYKQSSKLQNLLKNINSKQSIQTQNRIIIAGAGSFTKGLLSDLGKSITSPFTNFYYDKQQSSIINNVKKILKQNQKDILDPLSFAKSIKASATQLLKVLKNKYQYIQHKKVEQQQPQTQTPQNRFVSPPSQQQRLDLGGDVKNQQRITNTNHWTPTPSSQQKLNLNTSLPPIKIQPQNIDARFIHEIKNNSIQSNKQNLIKYLDSFKASAELLQLCVDLKDPQIYAAASRNIAKHAQNKSSSNKNNIKTAQQAQGPHAFIQDWIKINNYCDYVIQSGNPNDASKLFNSVASVINAMNNPNSDQKSIRQQVGQGAQKGINTYQSTAKQIISLQNLMKQSKQLIRFMNSIVYIAISQPTVKKINDSFVRYKFGVDDLMAIQSAKMPWSDQKLKQFHKQLSHIISSKNEFYNNDVKRLFINVAATGSSNLYSQPIVNAGLYQVFQIFATYKNVDMLVDAKKVLAKSQKNRSIIDSKISQV